MTTTAETGQERLGNPALYRLLAWLSPSFPTGAFSYSHGLEAAAARGDVCDRTSLAAWIAAIVAHGSGRIDADILRDAYRAVAAGDAAALAAASRRGAAYRATAELALESSQQGAAFLTTCQAAWIAPHPDPLPAGGERERGIAVEAPRPIQNKPSPPVEGRGQGEGGCSAGADFPLAPTLSHGGGEGAPGVCHAAAFGAAAARAGIVLEDALLGYLQAFAANLMSAGLRLGVVGQTDGQRILLALEPIVAQAAAAALTHGPEDFGGATFALDLASMAHETQYSRLFRS